MPVAPSVGENKSISRYWKIFLGGDKIYPNYNDVTTWLIQEK
jgi:hypothetical protein